MPRKLVLSVSIVTILFFVWGSLAPTAQSHSTSAPAGGGGEVTSTEAPEGAGPRDFVDLLGRLHPAIIHFPIGWIFMLAIVDTVALIFKREEWEKWGFYVLVGTVASFVPAIITGLMNASRQERTSEFVAFMPTHRNLIFVMAFLTVTALAIRAARRSRLDGASKWVYLGLVYAAVLMIAVAGDYGGKMVYGADYLPF